MLTASDGRFGVGAAHLSFEKENQFSPLPPRGLHWQVRTKRGPPLSEAGIRPGKAFLYSCLFLWLCTCSVYDDFVDTGIGTRAWGHRSDK